VDGWTHRDIIMRSGAIYFQVQFEVQLTCRHLPPLLVSRICRNGFEFITSKNE
jgi:hypothetical protein